MSKQISPFAAPAPHQDNQDRPTECTSSTPQMPRPQASIKKVAAILDFSERHIRELCARGELQFTGRLRGFRIYLDSVGAWQERNRRAN